MWNQQAPRGLISNILVFSLSSAASNLQMTLPCTLNGFGRILKIIELLYFNQCKKGIRIIFVRAKLKKKNLISQNCQFCDITSRIPCYHKWHVGTVIQNCVIIHFLGIIQYSIGKYWIIEIHVQKCIRKPLQCYDFCTPMQ